MTPPAAEPLPDDVETLKAMFLAQREALASAEARAAAAETNARDQALLIEKLEHQIARLRQERFGQSSERRALLDQLELQLFELKEDRAEAEQAASDAAQATQADETQAVQAFTRRKPARRPLPEHLPRERVVFPFGPARHCTVGKSGCLCGPSEEVALFRQGYLFPKFLEELCVPFLYAQVYYDRDGHWPWPDYDHDILGVLQSYLVSGSLESLEFTLWWSLNGGATWPWIRAILSSKKRPQGHTPCFCEKGAPIRNCHAEAWEGLKKLYADVHASGMELPPLEQGGRA